jgi:hypothetical protein
MPPLAVASGDTPVLGGRIAWDANRVPVAPGDNGAPVAIGAPTGVGARGVTGDSSAGASPPGRAKQPSILNRRWTRRCKRFGRSASPHPAQPTERGEGNSHANLSPPPGRLSFEALK